MATVKTAIVIGILALLQVSCSTARKQGGGSGGTPAVMTVNSFEKGGDGGGPSECDGKFHSNDDLIVALSTPFYAGGKRCHKTISITSVDNGRTVEAQVVDECDTSGDCKNNIVDSSPAVWKKLGLEQVMHRVGWACGKGLCVWEYRSCGVDVSYL